jgi:hypothetical protein
MALAYGFANANARDQAIWTASVDFDHPAEATWDEQLVIKIILDRL